MQDIHRQFVGHVHARYSRCESDKHYTVFHLTGYRMYKKELRSHYANAEDDQRTIYVESPKEKKT